MHERWWVLAGCLVSIATGLAVWAITPALAPHAGAPSSAVMAYSRTATEAVTTRSLVGAALLFLSIAVLAIYHEGVE